MVRKNGNIFFIECSTTCAVAAMCDFQITLQVFKQLSPPEFPIHASSLASLSTSLSFTAQNMNESSELTKKKVTTEATAAEKKPQIYRRVKIIKFITRSH